MIDFSAPLAGLQRAEASLNRTAARLATGSFSGADSVDLSVEMVALIEARLAHQANANVLRAEAETSRVLLDLLA